MNTPAPHFNSRVPPRRPPGVRLETIIPGSDIRASCVLISPTIAAEMLTYNTNNRRMRPTRLRRYRADIDGGRWTLTHQGVAFDEFGVLLDGQHRLQTIVNSGVSVEMLVFWNVPQRSRIAMDAGAPRTVADAGSYTQGEAAIARAMIIGARAWGTANLDTSNSAVSAFLDEHAAAVDFAVNACSPRLARVTVATVIAAIARAYYHVSRSRLQEFGKILATGFYDKGDLAAVTFRNYMLAAPRASANYASRRETYLKAERAIKAFVDREELTRCYAAPGELFDLPQDADAA